MTKRIVMLVALAGVFAAGKGHINLPKDVCLRIKGGHLQPKRGEEG